MNTKGYFIGHFLPGTAILIQSMWWIYAIFRDYYQSRRSNTPFRSHTSYKFEYCQNFPVESVSKIILFLITLTQVNQANNALLHVITIMFFLTEAILEIIRFYYRHAVLPNFTHLAYFLAFGVEALLFHVYFPGQKHLEMRLHSLLMITCVATAISTALEFFVRDNVMVALFRPYFCFVQGTWLINVGAILNPFSWLPTWEGHEHHELMMATIYWGWHILIGTWVLITVGAVTYLTFREPPLKANVLHVNGVVEDVKPLLTNENGINNI